MDILLIDENQKLTQPIKAYFENKLINVTVFNDYDEILDTLETVEFHHFALFVLAISVHDKRGLDLLDYMNLTHIHKPVIFISYDNDLRLLSKAFARDAEDFIIVPFAMKELELRMMKALRKTISKDEVSLSEDYSYIFSEQTLSFQNQFNVDLTPKQRELLYLLIMHKNSLVTYEMIQDSIYHDKPFSNNAIATHIRDIRKKVQNITIKAVKGHGYILKTLD